MMASKLHSADSQVSTQIRAEVHNLVKQQAVTQSTPLRFYIEAGMILVLNKSGSEVKKIIEEFRGGKK